jgi:DNA-directed RNA polymerase subunit RPC12/RpoP
MEKWILEMNGTQRTLTHRCDSAHTHDTHDILQQDIGGGYIRCMRCGGKFLPPEEPGNPRLLLRLDEIAAVSTS